MNERPISVPARASRRKTGTRGVALIAQGNLDIHDDRLEFAGWRLPVTGIRNARFERRLCKRAGRWVPNNNRLRFTCGDHDYKFRLEALEDLRGQLPFPVEDREVRLKPAGLVFHLIFFGLLALAYGSHQLFS